VPLKKIRYVARGYATASLPLTAKLLKRENRNSDQNLQSYRLTIELSGPEGPVIQCRQYRPVKSHIRTFADAALLQLSVRSHRGMNDHQSTNVTANELSVHLRDFFLHRTWRRQPNRPVLSYASDRETPDHNAMCLDKGSLRSPNRVAGVHAFRLVEMIVESRFMGYD